MINRILSVNVKLKISVLLILSLLIPAVLWLYIIFHPGSSYYGYGGADNVMHYLIARYAFQHPELFFHHWGKPVFTILSSPFAQLGMHGINLFNLLVSLLTCFFAWRTARRIKLGFPSLAVIFTAFSPVFFFSATSSLTEPLFALITMASVLCFINRKYILSAIIFSFSIFIRSESIILFPLFIVAYVLVRQWKPLPFLLSGFIIISLAGYPFYKEFFWFFTQMPYRMEQSIYGHGSLWHFVKNYRELFGFPLIVFIITGILFIMWKLFSDKTYRTSGNIANYMLIAGIPFIFLVAHSWVWFKGTGGSLGLLRVMACVSPLFALTGLYGYNLLLGFLGKSRKKVEPFIFSGIILFSIFFIYTLLPGFIFRVEDSESQIQETTDFLVKAGLDNQKIFYFNPLVSIYLQRDPWSENMVPIGSGMQILELVRPGDIYIWDSHLGPNEGGTPLDRLVNDSSFQLIMAVFSHYDEQNFVGSGHSVYTFRKLSEGELSDNHSLLEHPVDFILKRFTFTTLKEFRFTKKDTLNYDKRELSDLHPGTDSICFRFDTSREFFNVAEIPEKDLKTENKTLRLLFECSVFTEDTTDNELYIVFTVEDGKNLHYYKSLPVDLSSFPLQTWTYFCKYHVIPGQMKRNRIVKCYFWNKKRTASFFIDDVRLSVATD